MWGASSPQNQRLMGRGCIIESLDSVDRPHHREWSGRDKAVVLSMSNAVLTATYTSKWSPTNDTFTVVKHGQLLHIQAAWQV